MVSLRFVDYLTKSVTKQLKKVISAPPDIQFYGSNEDLEPSRGIMETIGRAVVGEEEAVYIAREYVAMRIHVNDPYLEYFDFITPVLNIRGRSIQGVATFSAVTPNPIPETFMLRGFIFAPSLYPYELLVNQEIPEKTILKEKMIDSAAINCVNAHKKLRKKLRGNLTCIIHHGTFNRSRFAFTVNTARHVPGLFSVTPYHDYSVMIAKDAGELSSEVDAPRYDFKSRYESFSGVAYHIGKNPEYGEEPEGILHRDKSMELSIGPLLKAIRVEAGVEEADEGEEPEGEYAEDEYSGEYDEDQYDHEQEEEDYDEES